MVAAVEHGQGPTLVLGAAGDPLHAEFQLPRSASHYGRLDHDAMVAAAEEVLGRVLPPVVELPGAHLARDADERAAAEALFAGLTAGPDMRGLRDRLIAARASAASVGRPLVLGLDVRRDDLRLLPWELLGSLPPEHAFAGVRVVRVLPTARTRLLRTGRLRLEVLLWEPRPDDAITHAAASSLASTLADQPRARLVRLANDLGTLPGLPDERVARVLHIVSHGRDLQEGVVLEAVSGESSPGALASSMGQLLDTVDVVVFGVCRAASDRVAPLSAPATRIASTGVPAVVGPRFAITPSAAAAFEAGLYAALCLGETLGDAVAEGRRRIAALDLAHPAGRHYNPALYLADRGAAARACLSSSAVAGWPPGDAAAEQVLEDAAARARSAGFFGVEHVALALADAPHAGRASRILRGHAPALRAALDHLRLRATPSLALATGRLSGLGESLAAGFRVEQLAEVIIDSPGLRCILGDLEAHRLLAFLSLGDDTEEHGTGAIGDPVAWSGESRRSPAPAPVQGDLRLEVLGGPEDGRRLTLPSGSILGRWDHSEAQPGPGRLHGPPGPESTRVSRRHARYLGQGAIQLEGSARLLRGRGQEDHRVRRRSTDSLPLELQLCVGDLLLLDVALEGAGVWLRVLDDLKGSGPPEGR